MTIKKNGKKLNIVNIWEHNLKNVGENVQKNNNNLLYAKYKFFFVF